MKLRKETVDVIMDTLENGIDDPGEFDAACRTAAEVMEKVCCFVEKHGSDILAFGAEWLYQTDKAQVDALELVADILEDLSEYCEGDA